MNCFITGKPKADKHHILTQKSHPEYKDCEWNIIYLCRELHQEWHRIGRNSFIKKYGIEEEMCNRGFWFTGSKWIKHKE